RLPSGRRCSRPTTCGSILRRVAPGAARPSSTSRRRSSRCSRSSCAASARPCPGSSSSTAPGTWPSRAGRTSSTCTCATCARRSTGPSAATRSRPCAASATDSTPAAGDRVAAAPRQADASLRACDGVVLAATGAFVYVRVGSALLTSVDQTLRAQAAEALPRLQQGKSLLDQDVPNGAGVAELLAPGGAVVATSRPGLPPLLDAADRSRVLAGRTLTATRDDLERLNDDWRLLAMPVRVAGARDVLVVAHSLDARRETLHRLRFEFVVAAPAALLLATLAGYLLAGAALRPVEAMRRRSAAIPASSPGSRLPVPQSHDEMSRLAETLNDMLGRLEAALEHERRF